MNNTVDREVVDQLNRETVLEETLPRFLSKKRAEDLNSKNAVMRDYLGMPVGLYMPMPALSDDGRNASVVITRNMLDAFEITEDEIFDRAIDNMSEQAEICSFSSVLKGLMPFIGEEVDEAMDPGVWYVSNVDRFFGAASILCPSVIRELEDRVGNKDLIILLSSVHETLVLANAGDPDMAYQMASMVREINHSTVDPSEQLADGVITCSNGVMSMVA